MTAWLPIALSLMALGFTIFSFWWMNWRPARLEVGNLANFAAGKATEGPSDGPNVVVISLPLVMFNSGARPLVIEALRLQGTRESGMGVLPFEMTESRIPTAFNEKPIERDYFFLPAGLKANELLKVNAVFEQRGTNFDFAQRLYHLKLQAKLSGRRDWIDLKDVELDFRDPERTPAYQLNNYYMPYQYRPHSGA